MKTSNVNKNQTINVNNNENIKCYIINFQSYTIFFEDSRVLGYCGYP